MTDEKLWTVAARVASVGSGAYPTSITAREHTIVADEPSWNGGGDTGPAPYELLLAALAACTSITMRMYAARKGWPLEQVSVDATYLRREGDERIRRTIELTGALDDDQRARLLEIAGRTPVTRTLERSVPVETRLSPAAPSRPA
jgi:putative redox protein